MGCSQQGRGEVRGVRIPEYKKDKAIFAAKIGGGFPVAS